MLMDKNDLKALKQDIWDMNPDLHNNPKFKKAFRILV